MIRRTRTTPRQQARFGAVTVEFALVLPIFFLVITGIIEFGRAFMVSQLIMNAAREGVRMASFEDATPTQVESFVDGMLVQSLGVTPTEVSVNCSVQLPDGTTSTNLADGGIGSTMFVEVSVPFSSVSLMNARWLGTSNLHARQAMRKF